MYKKHMPFRMLLLCVVLLSQRVDAIPGVYCETVQPLGMEDN